MEISDLRGEEDNFTLDKNGFKVFHDHLSDHFDLQNRDCMKSEIVPYLEDLVRKEVKDADLVKCFDWGGSAFLSFTCRFLKCFLILYYFRKNVNMSVCKMDINDKMQILNPGKRVHCGKSEPTLGRFLILLLARVSARVQDQSVSSFRAKRSFSPDRDEEVELIFRKDQTGRISLAGECQML